MTFDTLAYARRLKAAGFSDDQAEVLAEPNREMIADEMVTKSFLQAELGRLEAKFDSKIDQLRAEFRGEMKELEMRLTLRFGVMLAAAVAVLAAIIKL